MANTLVHEDGKLAIVTDGDELVRIDRETAEHVYTAWEWWLAAEQASNTEAHRWNLVLAAAQDYLESSGHEDEDAQDVKRQEGAEDFTQTDGKTLQLIADLDGDSQRREAARGELYDRMERKSVPPQPEASTPPPATNDQLTPSETTTQSNARVSGLVQPLLVIHSQRRPQYTDYAIHQRGCACAPVLWSFDAPVQQSVAEARTIIQQRDPTAYITVGACLRPTPVATHTKDADCTIDPATGLCSVCGVADGEPCPECGGRSFHLDGCSESDATAPTTSRYVFRFTVHTLETDDDPVGFTNIEQAKTYAASRAELGLQYEIWDGDTLAQHNF